MSTLKKVFIAASLFAFFSSNAALNESIKTAKIILIGRALEIRYIQLDSYPESGKVSIKGVDYPVFLTRESAVDYGTNLSIKSDITIVYVMTEMEKEKEIIELPR